MSTTMLDDYTTKLPIRPRFCDTDLLGHVNNAVYLEYFEAGRMEYWIEFTGDPSLENMPFILARAEVDFVAEAKAGEHLMLGVRIGKFGTKSFTLEYELVRADDGVPIARGVSVQVMFDYDNRTTQPISEELRQQLDEFEGGRLSNSD